MVNILKDTKMVYSCFYDKNGNLLKEPEGNLGRMRLPERNIKFLFSYIEFIMKSKLLNEASLIYIKSPLTTAKAVFIDYNKKNPDKELNLSTSISNIDYNRRKLNKVFDPDMLDKIIYHASFADMDKYQEQLEAAMRKYNKGTIFKGHLMVDLSKAIKSEKPETNRISEFMEAIQVYRVANKKLVEKAINSNYEDVIGYFNYLSFCSHLDEQQQEVWTQMQHFLNGTANQVDHIDHVDHENHEDTNKVEDDPVDDFDMSDFEVDGFSSDFDLPGFKD